ncbi:MAG: TIGR02147 family protein [Halobacteriovoraceae bacterium]|nr:TIGR02147 family protein [Halobacteriovoraceae bacterium]
MERPIVYKYYEYEKFLKDWFAYKKANHPSFSLRKFSKQSEISVGYLPMVIGGKRKLTLKMSDRLLQNMELDEDEKIHFELLVQLKNTKSQERKMRLMKTLERNKNYQEYNQHEAEVYRYLSHWYYVAIREAAGLKDFKEDPTWIENHFYEKISKAEIKKSLKFLLDKKFIEKNDQGEFSLPQDKVIKCYDGVFKLALTEFHKEMFNLAIKSIDTVSREHRNIKGHTFSIPKEKIEQAKKIIDEAEERMIELGEQDQDSDVVMQAQLALFPLSKIEDQNE